MNPKNHKIAFRVDSSAQIGIGHLIRCLTLANYLLKRKIKSIFICRNHSKNLISLLLSNNHHVEILPQKKIIYQISQKEPYSDWLGNSWEEDAKETIEIVTKYELSWLVVDHYAIDFRWEGAILPYIKNILVIDDLANRKHLCSILLDQNYKDNMHDKYYDLVFPATKLLLGPQYALIKEEFNLNRSASLKRKKSPSFKKLLIFMSGSDPNNETLKALIGAIESKNQFESIDLVIGEMYKFKDDILKYQKKFPHLDIYVQTDQMFKLMAEADIAIMGGGSVTWEKCTLGLPSLVTILAENQELIANSMHNLGAQITLGWYNNLTSKSYTEALNQLTKQDMLSMTKIASNVTDGLGLEKIYKSLGL